MQPSYELISVGTELLNGSTLNTNAHWLIERVSKIGGSVLRCTVIRDDISEVAAAVNEALLRKTRWIIISGGLGPTYDDITLEGVSKALKRPLRQDKKAVDMLKRRYASLLLSGLINDAGLTPPRLKMAKLPEGSEIMTNPIGTAPGVHIMEKGSSILCLPGVPNEMEMMFEKSLLKIVKKKEKRLHQHTTILRVRHANESSIAPLLQEMVMKYPDVYIKSHPRRFEDGISQIDIRFMAWDITGASAKQGSERAARAMRRLLSKSDRKMAIQDFPLV